MTPHPSAPRWAALLDHALSLAFWAWIAVVMWATWPVSGWVVVGIVIGVVAINLSVML